MRFRPIPSTRGVATLVARVRGAIERMQAGLAVDSSAVDDARQLLQRLDVLRECAPALAAAIGPSDGLHALLRARVNGERRATEGQARDEGGMGATSLAW